MSAKNLNYLSEFKTEELNIKTDIRSVKGPLSTD